MKIIVDHIKKTAGTSVGDFFRKSLGEDCVTPLIISEKIELSESLFRDYLVVSGHLSLSPRYTWPLSVYHTTILRDPIDRIVSHYYYVRGQRGATEPFAKMAKKFSIPDLIEMNDHSFIDVCKNFYCGHFLEGMVEKSQLIDVLANDNFSVREICEFISEKYQFVGITEHITSSLAIICFDNGINAEITDIRSRVTPKRLKVRDLDSNTLKKLESLAEKDIILYNYFKEEFIRRLGKVAQYATKYFLPLSGKTRRFVDRATILNPSITQIGMELVCPEFPKNDAGVSTKTCWLSMKFAVTDFQNRWYISICIESSIKQVIYREGRFFDVSSRDTTNIEFIWKFYCSLGEGIYHVSVTFHECAGEICGKAICNFDDLYQFAINNPKDHDIYGQCNLNPDFYFVESPTTYEAMQGSLTAFEKEAHAQTGELITVPIYIKNDGDTSWPFIGFHKVSAGYFIKREGDEECEEGMRTFLTANVEPNEEIAILLNINVPDKEGRWLISPALVQENIAWFSILSDAITLTVTGQHQDTPGV